VTRDDFQRQADLVREIPLEVVLTSWGAVRDRRDTSRWRTGRGPLSVTGTKFFSWHSRHGGGGAIDLVMHLGGWNARQAIEWLSRQFGCQFADATPAAGTTAAADPAPSLQTTPGSAASARHSRPSGRHNVGESTRRDARRELHLPAASLVNLPRVRRYLIQQRNLSPTILASLIDEGRLYADARGNAVFLMVAGKPHRPIGAELRGTGHRVWRGLAPGTRKNAGYFWIGHTRSKQIVLCESAIDAISCFQVHAQMPEAQLCNDCICISTAGVRPNPPWLQPLLARGYQIYCGFDADAPGETASHQMITRHSSIRRLRPPAHDWNDVLTTRNR
jgi:hypothetical protein